jgi:hypothetical protein
MRAASFLATLALSFATISSAAAQGTPEQIKSTLLRPGWSALWGECASGGNGESGVVFSTRGEKLWVTVKSYYLNQTCESEVEIAGDTVKFGTCMGIATVKFDPSDKKFPFKGTGSYCSSYKLKTN